MRTMADVIGLTCSIVGVFLFAWGSFYFGQRGSIVGIVACWLLAGAMFVMAFPFAYYALP